MSAQAFMGNIYPSGSPQASDSIYDNSNTGLPANVGGALDKTTGNIASLDTVELTSTATHSHAVGTYFIWIGQFVKTTVAIAVGDTIADSGNSANVEATNVGAILSELNSNYKIKIETLTKTTDQNGAFSLEGVNVISAIPLNQYAEYYCTLHMSLGGTTFVVVRKTDGSLITSKQLDVRIFSAV